MIILVVFVLLWSPQVMFLMPVYILLYIVVFGRLVVSPESVLLAILLGRVVHPISGNVLIHLY